MASPKRQAIDFGACDKIEDPDERRQAMLAHLQRIYETAMGRSRTVRRTPRGNDKPLPEIVKDPDCHAAVKCVEVAAQLLGIEPRKLRHRAPDLGPFEQPLKAVK